VSILRGHSGCLYSIVFKSEEFTDFLHQENTGIIAGAAIRSKKKTAAFFAPQFLN